MAFFRRYFFCVLVLSAAVLAQAQAGQSSSQLDEQQTAGSIGNARGEQAGFPVARDSFWDRVGFELSGGYLPLTGKGNGYFNNGYEVTGGLVDHLTAHINLLAEVRFFGLDGQQTSSRGVSTTYSNTDFSASVGASYSLFPRAFVSPYVLGTVGEASIGSVSAVSPGSTAQTLNASSAPVFGGGVGVSHRLYPDRRMALFAEARFERLNSSSSNLGQMTMMPIRLGLRW